MDPRVKKAYSGKLSALRQEKRIDSPLVRYNDLDQPVCKVCNALIKSESAWPAHQISRKHLEAVNNLKARAARAPGGGGGAAAASDVKSISAVAQDVSKARPSSSLPEGFFEKQETRRPKTSCKTDSVVPKPTAKSLDVKSTSDINLASSFSNKAPVLDRNEKKGALVSDYSMPSDEEDSVPIFGRSDTDERKGGLPGNQLATVSRPSASSGKQDKGALPEGFFDNKDADLRARGIQPVKVDIKDEYKEFQKQIQEDLQGFDERLEEEELLHNTRDKHTHKFTHSHTHTDVALQLIACILQFDAAEWREAMDSLEQKSYMEKVEMFKKNLEEHRATKPKIERKRPVFMTAEPSDESSSDGEDEEEENFAVDWRAKHL